MADKEEEVATVDSHTCHATGCDIVIPPKMFMCRKHWFSLPATLQRKIWNTYSKGQEVIKTPSSAYIVAAKECIDYIAQKYPFAPSPLAKKQ